MNTRSGRCRGGDGRDAAGVEADAGLAPLRASGLGVSDADGQELEIAGLSKVESAVGWPSP